jgi:hypothetical protein
MPEFLKKAPRKMNQRNENLRAEHTKWATETFQMYDICFWSMTGQTHWAEVVWNQSCVWQEYKDILRLKCLVTQFDRYIWTESFQLLKSSMCINIINKWIFLKTIIMWKELCFKYWHHIQSGSKTEDEHVMKSMQDCVLFSTLVPTYNYKISAQIQALPTY